MESLTAVRQACLRQAGLNYNHPAVRRLRHALTAVRTGSISSQLSFFAHNSLKIAILNSF
jgi:hypothetical protein